MNCTESDNLLYDYMEHLIPQADRDAVDAHRAGCQRCADLFRVAHEIRCRDVAEFLDDYVEDRLGPDRRAVFERHLAICTDCDSYLAGYRSSILLAQALPDGSPPPDVPRDLIEAILAARMRPDKR